MRFFVKKMSWLINGGFSYINGNYINNYGNPPLIKIHHSIYQRLDFTKQVPNRPKSRA